MNPARPYNDRRRNSLSALTGEFRWPGQETEFRASLWPEWHRRIRAVVLVGVAAYVLTSLTDLLLLGTGWLLSAIIAGRLLVAAFGLGFITVAGKRRSPLFSDLGLLVFLILLISFFLGMVAVRPDALRYSGPAAVLILCVFYAVPMTRMWITLANASYLSVGILAVAAAIAQSPPRDIAVFSVQLLVLNLIGFFIALRMQQDARMAWVNQQSLERREQHQRLLAQLSSQFLGVRNDQLDASVRQALKTLCEYTGSDRAYLMEFDTARETASMTHEWCAEGIPATQAAMQNIPSGLMPWASLKMQRGEIVQADRVSDLPPEANAERDLNLAQGVQSFLCVPLTHEGLLHGTIGLDCVRRQRNWDAETVDLLRFVGQAAFNALHRARAEISLRESESQSQTLTRLSPIGIFRTDADGYCLYFNENWKALTGLSPEMALGDRWRQAVHPDDRERVDREWHETVTRKSSVESEFRYLRPDGSVVWAHVRAHPQLDDNGRLLGFIGTVDDITGRRRAQIQLEQRARLDECLNAMTVRFLRHEDSDTNVVVQQTLSEIASFTGADRCGYFVMDAARGTMSCTHQWLRSEVEARDLSLENLPLADYGWAVPRLLRGETVSIPRTAALPPEAAGERSKLEANAVRSLLLVPILSAGRITSFISLTAVHSEASWDNDVVMLMRITGEIILNALQRQATDQSQQQHIRDLETVNLELERRNTDLQKLSYVASHDLQEPLRTVSSFSSLLAQHYRGHLDARADEYIGYITDAAARLHRLINDLLAYTRVDHQVRAPVACDFNEIAGVVRDNLAETIAVLKADIEWGGLPTVMADPLQMIQLLQHLVANALRFHADEPPRISIRAEHDNGGWVLSVADNGIGIAPEHATRVFEIFQRLHTKDSYPGSGIGLAVCRRIVERHGGRIWVEPNPPHGSVFRFTLPDAQAGHPSLHQAA